MTLRGLLALLDQGPADSLTSEQREWILVAAATRGIHRHRQAAVEQRIAEVADESWAEDPGARRRREFWQAVTPAPARRVVLQFDRRQA